LALFTKHDFQIKKTAAIEQAAVTETCLNYLNNSFLHKLHYINTC